MGATMSTAIKWLLKTVITPLLIDWLVALYKKLRKAKDFERKSKDNIQASEVYEKIPSSDTFDNLP